MTPDMIEKRLFLLQSEWGQGGHDPACAKKERFKLIEGVSRA